MEIRQLRNFLIIARERSFSRAAEKIHIAQPALSRQMQMLEHDLGVTLFVRSTKGVETTNAGDLLVEMAQVALRYVDEIKPTLSGFAGKLSGTFALGLAPSLTPLLAEPVLDACERRYPDLKVRIVEGLSMFLCEWLDQSRLDLAVFTDVGPVPRIATRQLSADEVVLVGRDADLAGFGESVTWDELEQAAGLRLVLTPGVENVIARALHRPAEDMAFGRSIDSIREVKTMMMHGGCTTILPYTFVHAELDEALLRAIPFAPRITRKIVAARKSGRPRGMVGEAVEGIVRTEYERLERFLST